jgi:hypothetical protein
LIAVEPMDKISEILDDIKLRLSSPFIFSFIISWCIWNWRIPLGLIWYDSTELEQHGSLSVFEFIKTHARGHKAFLWPFLSALAYTLVFPWLNTVIKWYSDWVISMREKRSLELLGKTHIAIDIFNESREALEQEKQVLQQTIDNLKQDKNIIKELRLQLDQEANAHNELKAKLKKMRDVSSLNGHWMFTKAKQSYDLTIKDGRITFTGDQSGKVVQFSIAHYFYDDNEKIITFTKLAAGNSLLPNHLRIQGDRLEGQEGLEQVRYRRIQILPSVKALEHT